jgi:transcription termination factor Rho
MSIRRAFSSGSNSEVTEYLINKLVQTRSNEEFIEAIKFANFRD